LRGDAKRHGKHDYKQSTSFHFILLCLTKKKGFPREFQASALIQIA